MADSILADIEKRAEAILATEGFSRSGPIADRHGVLQIVFISSERDIDNFVRITEVCDDSVYVAGIELLACHGTLTMHSNVMTASSPGEFQRSLKKALARAVAIARTITVTDFRPHSTNEALRAERASSARNSGGRLDETFTTLAEFLNSLDAEGEQRADVRSYLVILCPRCGKNVAFRGRCPKCAGNDWIPAGPTDELARQIKHKGVKRALLETPNAWTIKPRESSKRRE